MFIYILCFNCLNKREENNKTFAYFMIIGHAITTLQTLKKLHKTTNTKWQKTK
jgi:hypothetical protein